MKLAMIWLAGALGLGLTAELAFEHLWIVAYVPLFIWAAFGVVLALKAGWSLRRQEQRRSAAAALLALLLGAIAFNPTAYLGSSLTTMTRFALQRPRYEEVISTLRDSIAVRGHPAGGDHEYHGLRYIVESGPPLRLAFPWPGGILDNWCGAVYDSTGVVMQANNFHGDWSKWEDQVPLDIRRMFGGDMLYCAELKVPFYHCCFT